MKKTIHFLIAALLCGGVFLLSGCGKKEENTKVIRVATDASFPPYEYYDHGEIVGIDAEIVREIARVFDYELVIFDERFEQVIPGVKSGKWDVGASGLTITHARKMEVDFTIPYETILQLVIVPDGSGLKTPADLKKATVRIGVQSGTTGDTYVAKNIHAPLRFNNVGLAFAALKKGELDAVVCDSDPAEHMVSEHPGFKLLPEPLVTEEYAFAISKNNPKLLKDFNAGIVRMKSSGRLKAILDKYRKKATK